MTVGGRLEALVRLSLFTRVSDSCPPLTCGSIAEVQSENPSFELQNCIYESESRFSYDLGITCGFFTLMYTCKSIS